MGTHRNGEVLLAWSCAERNNSNNKCEKRRDWGYLMGLGVTV